MLTKADYDPILAEFRAFARRDLHAQIQMVLDHDEITAISEDIDAMLIDLLDTRDVLLSQLSHMSDKYKSCDVCKYRNEDQAKYPCNSCNVIHVKDDEARFLWDWVGTGDEDE